MVIGALYDDSLGDELRVTVIATGVGEAVPEKRKLVQVNVPPTVQASSESDEAKGDNRRLANLKPADPNPQSAKSLFPSSNFSGLDNHTISSGEPSQSGKDNKAWNEDYLETPTYLRKKAN